MRFRRSSTASRNGKQLFPAVSTGSPDLSVLDDEALMQELIRGCGEALSILYDRYYVSVFWIARRILGNDDEAEDTVQQVFLETFRSRAAFKPEKGSFRAWISRRTYDRARNQRGYLITHNLYTLQQIDESLPASDVSPEILIFAAELFGKLSPRKQVIIGLTFSEGLTAEEVAERTGYTLSVVRHDFYRGLKELRTTIEQGRRLVPETEENKKLN
jgi:RNA polymerase sigma-70 factor (ECF subfamily)